MGQKNDPSPTEIGGFRWLMPSNRGKTERVQRRGERVVNALFSDALRPINQGLILVFAGDAAKPCATFTGAHQGDVGTAARAEARCDSEVDVLCKVVFVPESLQFRCWHGHVALVDAPAAATIANVDRWLHA